MKHTIYKTNWDNAFNKQLSDPERIITCCAHCAMEYFKSIGVKVEMADKYKEPQYSSVICDFNIDPCDLDNLPNCDCLYSLQPEDKRNYYKRGEIFRKYGNN